MPSSTPNFLVSAVALCALAACTTSPERAAQNPRNPSAWKIEPVMSVRHADNASKSYYTLGRYYDGMRAWDRSIDAYQKSIVADARNVEAHNALGAALAQRSRMDEAEAAFRRALALDANLAHVQSNLGYVLMISGQPQAAVAALKVALRLDPDNVTTRANLRQAVAQWDVARGLEPAAAPAPMAVAVAVSVDSPTPNASHVAAPLPLPASIEVMRPITVAQVAQPTGAPVEALDPPPNVAQVARPVLVSQGPATADASSVVASSAPPVTMTQTAMRVINEPNIAAFKVQGMAPALAPMPLPMPSLEAAKPAQAPTTPQVAPPVLTRPIGRIEVLNGSGVSGDAKRASQWLAWQGVGAARIGNHRAFDHKTTVIRFQPGYRAQAIRIAAALRVPAQLRETEGLQPQAPAVRVVLGRDWQSVATCMNKAACAKPDALVAGLQRR